MTNKRKLKAIEKAIYECEETYPMTGKPDKDAAYKNGWYDCAYFLKCLVKELK